MRSAPLVCIVLVMMSPAWSWILCGCEGVIRESQLSRNDCVARLRDECVSVNSLIWFMDGSSEPDQEWPPRSVWNFVNTSDTLCVDQPAPGSFLRLLWDKEANLLTMIVSGGTVNGTSVHNATATATPSSAGLLYFQDVRFPFSPHLFAVRALDAHRHTIQVYSQASLKNPRPLCLLTFVEPSFELQPSTIQVVAVALGCVIGGGGAAVALLCIAIKYRKKHGQYMQVN